MEITTDIPSFLKPGQLQKAKEQIRQWEERNRANLTKKEKVINAFKITSGLDTIGMPEGIDKGNMGIEHRFGTACQDKWQLLVQKPIEYKEATQLEDWQLAQAIAGLTTRQRFDMVNNQEEQKHERGVHFLISNWPKLASIFYPINPERRNSILGYSEVYLNGYGVADFIGIGPDGRFFIFEFGKSGKQAQVERHKQGLMRILNIPEDSVQTFKVNYSSSSKETTLIIVP